MVYSQEEISEKNEDNQTRMIYLINEGRNMQNNINDIEFSSELGIACENCLIKLVFLIYRKL